MKAQLLEILCFPPGSSVMECQKTVAAVRRKLGLAGWKDLTWGLITGNTMCRVGGDCGYGRRWAKDEASGVEKSWPQGRKMVFVLLVGKQAQIWGASPAQRWIWHWPAYWCWVGLRPKRVKRDGGQKHGHFCGGTSSPSKEFPPARENSSFIAAFLTKFKTFLLQKDFNAL